MSCGGPCGFHSLTYPYHLDIAREAKLPGPLSPLLMATEGFVLREQAIDKLVVAMRIGSPVSGKRLVIPKRKRRDRKRAAANHRSSDSELRCRRTRQTLSSICTENHRQSKNDKPLTKEPCGAKRFCYPAKQGQPSFQILGSRVLASTSRQSSPPPRPNSQSIRLLLWLVIGGYLRIYSPLKSD